MNQPYADENIFFSNEGSGNAVFNCNRIPYRRKKTGFKLDQLKF